MMESQESDEKDPSEALGIPISDASGETDPWGGKTQNQRERLARDHLRIVATADEIWLAVHPTRQRRRVVG